PEYLPAKVATDDRAAFRDGVVQPGERSRLSPAVRAALDAHGTVALTRLDDLGQQILSDLWPAVESELEERRDQTDTYSRARNDHERFLTTRTQLFHGRERLLKRMAGYTSGESARGPLVVTGSPGSGKSSLLAEFARRCRGEFRQM